jgi:hypothetical protein
MALKKAWFGVLFMRDAYHSGHMRRVTQYTWTVRAEKFHSQLKELPTLFAFSSNGQGY